MNRGVTYAIVALACLGTMGAAAGQETPKGRVTDVPDDMRQAIIARLQKTFVYPQLVIWKFDFMQPYPTEGIAVCGRVNFPDSTRHYLGEQNFYAHVHGGEVVEAGIVSRRAQEDPVLGNATAYKVACS